MLSTAEIRGARVRTDLQRPRQAGFSRSNELVGDPPLPETAGPVVLGNLSRR